jgi:error-prone DNA polymerase
MAVKESKSIRFAELLGKSCFSFLRGASHPEEMIERAHHLGYSGFGLCDHHGFYGMVRGYKKASELQLPLVIGTEIQIEGAALVLFAKNIQGYRRLCRLLTESFTDQEKGKSLITRELFEKWMSPVDIQLALAPRQFPSSSLLDWLQIRYPFFQFVTKRLDPDADLLMKKWVQQLAPETPKVWTWDAQFHESSRFELFEVLQAIRENIPLSQKLPSLNGEAYLKSLSALQAYRVPTEWIRNSIRFLESCSFSPAQIRYQYPREWLPPHKTPTQFLRELCEAGIQRRYPQGPNAVVLQQLEHELKLIQELEYEDYFLTVWDLVQYARSQKILCQGRGSAANSIVCYLLEVTSIDPVQMNLLFERFISKERNEAPDIDIDFEHERREEVIQYVYQKYGRHRAGMVATLITYRTKSALRDIGRILEAPSDWIDDLCKRTRWRENVFESENSGNDPLKSRVLRLARQLKGFPRHLGQHTGGMIICQDRLDEISPIESASMPGRSVVQWDKYDVEALGLLKIDLLSLGMLTCLRKSLELLHKHRGLSIDLHQIPHGDPKTYKMIGESQTVGVFQIESRAQMSMLPRLQPKNFYDLVIEVAIVRPGPIQGGMVHPYLRRRMGLEPVQYAHPRLKPILEKTLGIPIFQEQVMKIAIEVAGYSPGEADALRRAMGAWKKSGNLEKFGDDICARLIERGVPSEFSRRICDQILGFGEYGFPESHAASFALLTYASAYLKANYPEVFLCALLNSMPLGFYSLNVLTSAFLREGVRVLPLSLEKSSWDHQLEALDGPTDAKNQWALRLGLRIVRGLHRENAERFLLERTQKNKMNLYHFNADERASLALTQENEVRRQKYWDSLLPPDSALFSNIASQTPFKIPDSLSALLLDFDLMETSLRDHPAQILKEHRWHYPLSKNRVALSSDLHRYRENQSITVFGITQVIQSPPTANGMFFITLEDETGFLNLVLQPPIFQKFKNTIQKDWGLLVTGKLQKMGSSRYTSILVTQIIPKQRSPQVQSLYRPQYSPLPQAIGFSPRAQGRSHRRENKA